MANDVVGGEPVTLSYCTLCGSAVLYSGRLASGRVLTFGTSGLLYRSNKLMVDRDTGSLWPNLTGEAVVGRSPADPGAGGPGRASSCCRSPLTTWGEWRGRHPDTTVLALEPEAGRALGLRLPPRRRGPRPPGGVVPGLEAERPARPRNRDLRPADGGRPEGLPARSAGGSVAWSTTRSAGWRSSWSRTSDERRGARVRERRPPLHPRPGRAPARRRRAAPGGSPRRPWSRPRTPASSPLPRVPGHVAFWFGWFGFYPGDAGVRGIGLAAPLPGSRGLVV